MNYMNHSMGIALLLIILIVFCNLSLAQPIGSFHPSARDFFSSPSAERPPAGYNQPIIPIPEFITIPTPQGTDTEKPGVAALSETMVSLPNETEQILVRYDTSMISALSHVEVEGTEIVREYSDAGIPGLVLAEVPVGGIDAAISAYSALPGVLYAEPDYIWQIDRVPDDPEFWRQWGMQNTGQVYRTGTPAGTSGADGKLPGAWDISTGSTGVLVAVLDTGIDYTHPDLAQNIWTGPSGEHGYDVVNKDADPMDDHGHGTHCAGIIGAAGNNGVGVAGVNWQTRMMAVKVLDSSGRARVSDIIEGIEYATRMGADVVSCSFGGGNFSQAAYDAFSSSPALFVCAAGNTGNNNDINPHYPSSYQLPNILGVAATDAHDRLASYSNYGTTVHLAAPGDQIYSTYWSNKQGERYAYYNGSSQATALVSGMAAFLKGLDASLTPARIKELLVTNSDPVSALQGRVAANGRVNLHKAASSISEKDVIPLKSGWNFVSVPRPLAAGSDTAVIFANVDSGGHSVLTYENPDGWRAMKATDPVTIMNGVWIYSTKHDEVQIQYHANPRVVTKTIQSGWNTYGLPSTHNRPAKEALFPISSIWKYVVGYNADIQQYENPIVNGGTGDQSDDREIKPFMGYWLYSSGQGSLSG